MAERWVERGKPSWRVVEPPLAEAAAAAVGDQPVLHVQPVKKGERRRGSNKGKEEGREGGKVGGKRGEEAVAKQLPRHFGCPPRSPSLTVALRFSESSGHW